jgi:nucleotide-binding universal stress UspA family protein
MLTHVLAATDGSQSGDRAVAFAVALARQEGAALSICTAIDSAGTIAANASPFGFDAGTAIAAQRAEAQAALSRGGETAAQAGVAFEGALLDGSTAEAIALCVEARGVDAVVIGRHDASDLERFFLGSTTADILRRCDVPVFVVPRDATPANAANPCMLVALDDSAPSDAALEFALRFAQSKASSLVLCSVVDAPAAAAALQAGLWNLARTLLSHRAEVVEARHVACETAVVVGEPADAIVATARAHAVGAIVIGTHGRRGVQRMLLGSVAEAVVRAATVPVVVVRTLPHPLQVTTVRQA